MLPSRAMTGAGPEHATVPHSALSYFAAEAAETARLAARACRVPIAMARIESDGAAPLVGLVGLDDADADPTALAALADIGRALAAGRTAPGAFPLGLQHVLAAPIASGGAPTAGFLLIATTDPHPPSLSDIAALRTLGRRLAESLALRRQTRELRATEAALRGSEARFRAVVETIEEGLFICDAAGLVVDLNPAAARLLGASRDSLKGTPLSRHVDSAELRGVDASGAVPSHETTARRANGSVFPASLFIHPIEVAEGRLLVAHLHDLSSRKEIETLRRQFVSMVSHELRTPLTSVRASLGLLALGATGVLPEPAQRVVSIAERNTERLVGLINDIIDLERAEGGHLRLNLGPVDVRAVIDRAVETVSPLAAQEQMTIEVARAGSGLIGDAERITQVLVNLISNAVKFTPKGSRIVVSAEDIGEAVRFTVTDQGPGIPESARALIFEPFRQMEDSDTRKKGGSGLGLAICRAIVERHEGTIGVLTAPEGGAVFHFTLPKEGPTA